MIKSMQRCQNCRFFKRTWEKVQKREYVLTYLDYNELDEGEKRNITINYLAPHLRPRIMPEPRIIPEDENRDMYVGNYKEPIITEKGPYVRERMVYWDEYVRLNRGVCRRYPPHPYHSSPTVNENHYCGEWRPILVSMNISAYEEE